MRPWLVREINRFLEDRDRDSLSEYRYYPLYTYYKVLYRVDFINIDSYIDLLSLS